MAETGINVWLSTAHFQVFPSQAQSSA